jgi:hypothetical protein
VLSRDVTTSFIKGGKDALFTVDEGQGQRLLRHVCHCQRKAAPSPLTLPCYATASMSRSNIWCDTDVLYVEDEALDTVAEDAYGDSGRKYRNYWSELETSL